MSFINVDVLNNRDGSYKRNSLKAIFEYEINFLSPDFFNYGNEAVERMLKLGLLLQDFYIGQVLIKEAENYSKEFPSYEMSIYFNQDQSQEIINKINEIGLIIESHNKIS